MTEVSDGTAGMPSRRLRILVAEDNRDAADSLAMLLEMLGYRVSVARTGPDAIEVAKRERPDVLLCDIGLPGVSGYDIARKLRADKAAAGMLMIAVTGYAEAQDRVYSAMAGFDKHVSKAASPCEVIEALANFEKHCAARELRTASPASPAGAGAARPASS